MVVVAHDYQRKLLQHFTLVENCLIAEFHRLHALVPPQFFETSATSVYTRILADFGHFNNPGRLQALLTGDEASYWCSRNTVFIINFVQEAKAADETLARQHSAFFAAFHKATSELVDFIAHFAKLRAYFVPQSIHLFAALRTKMRQSRARRRIRARSSSKLCAPMFSICAALRC